MKGWYYFILLPLIIFSGCKIETVPAEDSLLFPRLFEREGLFGYIDTQNRVVIGPGFEDADPFTEGLGRVAVVLENGEYRSGYIDSTGSFVIEPQFYKARPFSEGLALICDTSFGNNVQGCAFIDKSGKRVIGGDIALSYPPDFHDGIAHVKFLDGVRRTGKFERTVVRMFGFKLRDNILTYTNAIIDRKGNIVFSEKGGDQTGTYEYNGKEIIPEEPIHILKNRIAWNLRNRRFATGDESKKLWGYLSYSLEDYSGPEENRPTDSWAIPPKFESAGMFFKGYAPVKMGNEFGYIDTLGNVVCSYKSGW